MNIYFLKINTKLLFEIFIYVFVYINFCILSFSDNTYLNDYGHQANNLYNMSFGCGGNFMPYCRTVDDDIVKYNEIYAGINGQGDTVIQTFDSVQSFGFFPYVGIELGYTTLKYHITSVGSKKKKYTYGDIGYVCFFFGSETNANSILRCVPQFGLGISYSDMPRRILIKDGGIEFPILEIKTHQDLNKIEHLGIIFMNKYVFKVRFGTDYECHLHIGYSYNFFLGVKFDYTLSGKRVGILLDSCEKGVFNVFINGRINLAYNKRLEDINWFNDGFVYKIEHRKCFFSFGFLPLGIYYTSKDIEGFSTISANNYYGVNLDFSSPFLLYFSEIHYLGIYADVIFAIGKNKKENISISNIFAKYSNAKCGIVISSKYKSFRSEHRFGWFIFTNSSFFAEREISIENYSKPTEYAEKLEDKKKLLRHILSDHFTYSYRIYINIPQIWISKYFRNVIHISAVYVAVNLILWAKMNNKTYYKIGEGASTDYKINYSLAKLDSISIGICL